MTETFKIIGQFVTTTNSLTDLYTVPVSTTATISSIVICNQNGSDNVLFRISIAENGDPDDPKQYLYYDLPLGMNDTFIATIGVSLGDADVIRVQADLANVSFNIFGVEVSA